MVPPDDSGGAALADALAQLYAVPPDEFVATRTRLVQEAKDSGDKALAKEVNGLRRPTVSAWTVNQVVRRRPETVTALRDVGRRLRAAQGQLDAAALRDLRPDRDRLLDDWAAAATDVAAEAGRPLAPAALDEVRGTVIAALAADEATEAVTSGHLTRALSYSGFGEVDLSEAVVRTSSGAVLSVVPGAGTQEAAAGSDAPKAKAGRKGTDRHTSPGPAAEEKPTKKAKEKAADEQAAEKSAKADARAAKEKEAEDEAAAAREAAHRERVEAAREAHAAAVEAAKEAKRALDEARDRADETRWRVEELEDQLKQARADHRATEQTATEAARARRAAEVEVARAEKSVRDAEARRG